MATTDNVLFAALPNLAAVGTPYTDQQALTANGDHTGEQPSRITVLTDMKPIGSTFISLDCERGVVDWIGAINHNLDRRRGSLWRAWAVDRGGLPFDVFTSLEQLFPTSTDASSNLSGNHTAVDDDPWASASAADYVQGAAAGAWSARFGFATPGAALSTVGNDHAIVIRARNADATDFVGTLAVKLYESDALVSTLIAATVVGEGDTRSRSIFVCKFSTSSLATATGANVQIQVEGSTQLIRVESVLWVAGLGVTGAADSGFLDVDSPPASAAFGSVSAALSGAEPTQTEFKVFSTPVDLTAAAYPMVAVAFVNGTNAASPTNTLGVLAAGKAYNPPINPLESGLSVEDPSSKGRTLGGQNVGANRRRRRRAHAALEDITRADMLELFERIDWRRGRLGPFFVCLFPTDALTKRISGFWATLGEAEQLNEWIPYNAADGQDSSVIRWKRTYFLEEML